jgi:UDP-N-acetylmuramoylalanine-D-glutamate ligase
VRGAGGGHHRLQRKTTTTSLVGRMLAADGREAWVGGNIGQPLLERLVNGAPCRTWL